MKEKFHQTLEQKEDNVKRIRDGAANEKMGTWSMKICRRRAEDRKKDMGVTGEEEETKGKEIDGEKETEGLEEQRNIENNVEVV